MVTPYTIARESNTAQKHTVKLTEMIHNEALEICYPVLIDVTVIKFLSDIIVESLSHRKAEWLLRGIEPSELSMGEIVRLIRPSLFKLLSEAKNSARNEGREYLLLIDILVGIHIPWCRIFPFCREA